MSQFHSSFVGVNIYFSHQCYITVIEIFVQNDITFQVLNKLSLMLLFCLFTQSRYAIVAH